MQATASQSKRGLSAELCAESSSPKRACASLELPSDESSPPVCANSAEPAFGLLNGIDLGCYKIGHDTLPDSLNLGIIGHHDDDHGQAALLSNNALIHAESVPEATISPSALHGQSQSDNPPGSDSQCNWEESSEDGDWEEVSEGTSSDEDFEALAEEIAGLPPNGIFYH